MFRIGIDIGGTFTDFSVADDNGNVRLYKEPSRPADPIGAILDGLDGVAPLVGLTRAEMLAQTRLLVHGTTIATNTVIQRNGPKLGLISTRGFRDVLYFRDAFKPERFNIRISPPEPFVERYLRVGVTERIWSDGSVLTPLDEGDVRSAARYFAEHGVEAVCVSLLWSIVNPVHERRVVTILGEELPDTYVVAASDVLPEIREWERTSAGVLSAYVLPGVDGYMRRLEGRLREAGLRYPPLIMQLNGGCASIDDILRRPVYVLHSGPAAAPAAASYHASHHGIDDLITVDMGGTSFDICLIRGGQPIRTRGLQVEMQPVGVASVDVHSIGAGGGSVAFVDSGGALRVGPRSAGSVPGPAAYGAGGTEPTVTDANVVLGYIAAENFLAGRREMRPDLSEQAVAEQVGRPLGLAALEAAAGIIRVVNTNMAAAIRAASIERGYDPRQFALLVGGGAGGLHASALASELGIERVLIPRDAGTLCAFGMTVTDVRHDFVRAAPFLSSTLVPETLESIFSELEAEGAARLRDGGFTQSEIRFERSVDARYPGQVHELTVPVPADGRAFGDGDIAELRRIFHDEHRRQFNYDRPELEVEFLHWRVGAIGSTPSREYSDGTATAADASGALIGTRTIYLAPTRTMEEVSVYQAETLGEGAVVNGPAVIAGETTTILVGPGDLLTCGADGFELSVAVAATTVASAVSD